MPADAVPADAVPADAVVELGHAPSWASGLAAELEASAGVPPLNDVALNRLRFDPPGVVHLALDESAYAQLDLTGSGPVSAEIAARTPAAAAALLAAAEHRAAGRPVLAWAHGRSSSVGPAARERGYEPVRELLQLRRRLDERPAVPTAPAGVRIRTFRPGRDETAWITANSAAFARHPEQGGVDIEALGQLEDEPWFDPAGFLLAVSESAVGEQEELLGYHWTKQHGNDLGEVYVLGIVPAAQGHGLGGLLLGAGLAHLFDAGARVVLLYVEGDNSGARHLYERAGFVEHDRDIQFRSPSSFT